MCRCKKRCNSNDQSAGKPKLAAKQVGFFPVFFVIQSPCYPEAGKIIWFDIVHIVANNAPHHTDAAKDETDIEMNTSMLSAINNNAGNKGYKQGYSK